MKDMGTLNQELPLSNQDYISTERFSSSKKDDVSSPVKESGYKQFRRKKKKNQ